MSSGSVAIEGLDEQKRLICFKLRVEKEIINTEGGLEQNETFHEVNMAGRWISTEKNVFSVFGN